MFEQPYYVIGDKQYSRDELLIFGRQHYPKFYWIKRGIGIGLLSIGLTWILSMLICLIPSGFPRFEGDVATYTALFVTPTIFSIVGVVLFSISFISLPEESYIKHAYDYFTKLNRRSGQRDNRINQRQENKNLDQLLKYKELLDKGAITQEEYEQKKKELL